MCNAEAVGIMLPYSAAQQDYGAALANKVAANKTTPAFRTPRRRMNLVPIFLCLFFPWLLFSATYGVASFQIHDATPHLYFFLLGCGLAIVITASVVACEARFKLVSTTEKDPSWQIFLALSLLVAWVGGIVLGNANYSANLQPFYNLQNLNSYRDIDPSKMRGEQLMDAGVMSFAQGTTFDVTKSMGFSNKKVYCVAPITMGSTKPLSYDLWVVGTDCCTVNKADFHCTANVGRGTKGGFRLLAGGSDRALYRLAVQQAEASYKIAANHPLFFTWVNDDPMTLVAGWFSTGKTQYLLWSFAHFAFQAFAVATATLAFSQLDKF